MYATAWRRRAFGRRSGIYFWTIALLLSVLVATIHLGSKWSVAAGSWLGGAIASGLLLPVAFMPSRIRNWQKGAWGEEMTAAELKALNREVWRVAHDIAWGKGNHDHVVAGPAIYVLNTKNRRDCTVAVEGHGLRVTQIDTGDSYLEDRWLPSLESEATTLKRTIERTVGFPVHVYPVVVIWGDYAAGHEFVGDVSVIRGDRLVAWLRDRPADLLTKEKQNAVKQAVRRLPHA